MTCLGAVFQRLPCSVLWASQTCGLASDINLERFSFVIISSIPSVPSSPLPGTPIMCVLHLLSLSHVLWMCPSVFSFSVLFALWFSRFPLIQPKGQGFCPWPVYREAQQRRSSCLLKVFLSPVFVTGPLLGRPSFCSHCPFVLVHCLLYLWETPVWQSQLFWIPSLLIPKSLPCLVLILVLSKFCFFSVSYVSWFYSWWLDCYK